MRLLFPLCSKKVNVLIRQLPLLTLSVLTFSLVILLPNPKDAFAENLTGQLQFAEGTYRINTGDILSINVYNQPDFSESDILVRPDGNVTLNGIGEVQVVGKTIREATQLIDSQLRELVKEPRISLTVKDAKPPCVYLAGAVMRPGLIQAGTIVTLPSNNTGNGSSGSSQNSSNGSVTGSTASRVDFRLSNVIASAGGVKMYADLANVTISRDGELYKTVNLWNLIRMGQADGDILLQNGDSIYIPELPSQAIDDETFKLLLTASIGPQVFPVRILGDVKAPGVYDLNGNTPYLNSAIAKGGGFNYGANRRSVAIRRFSGENKFSTIFVNPNQFDFLLRPNDVVYVAESKISKAGRFGEHVSQVLAPFTTASNAAFGLAVLGRIK